MAVCHRKTNNKKNNKTNLFLKKRKENQVVACQPGAILRMRTATCPRAVVRMREDNAHAQFGSGRGRWSGFVAEAEGAEKTLDYQKTHEISASPRLFPSRCPSTQHSRKATVRNFLFKGFFIWKEGKFIAGVFIRLYKEACWGGGFTRLSSEVFFTRLQ